MILFLVETVLVSWTFYLGVKQISKQEMCPNICTTKQASTYLFNMDSDLCECFDINQELIYSEVLR